MPARHREPRETNSSSRAALTARTRPFPILLFLGAGRLLLGAGRWKHTYLCFIMPAFPPRFQKTYPTPAYTTPRPRTTPHPPPPRTIPPRIKATLIRSHSLSPPDARLPLSISARKNLPRPRPCTCTSRDSPRKFSGPGPLRAFPHLSSRSIDRFRSAGIPAPQALRLHTSPSALPAGRCRSISPRCQGLGSYELPFPRPPRIIPRICESSIPCSISSNSAGLSETSIATSWEIMFDRRKPCRLSLNVCIPSSRPC